MKKPVIIIGMGEMGGVFARGFLKSGYPVFPVGRKDDIDQLAMDIKEPELVLVAVGEKDLGKSLSNLAGAWLDKLVLLQNELLPRDWSAHPIEDPTVISVWFEKKPGQDFKVLISSPVFGPHAGTIKQALGSLDIPVHEVSDDHALLSELVVKNLYILTTNICGLEVGGSVSELWNDNAVLMNHVFDDVLNIQQHLTGQAFNRDQLLTSVLNAFDGDPDHRCMGRSAPARLQRALQIAESASLEVPELNRIAEQTSR